MFRILNNPISRLDSTVSCEPEVHFLCLYGENVAFDANSLCAVQVDDALCARLREVAGGIADWRIPPVLPGIALFAGHAPSFSLRPTGPLRKLVLNLTHACNLRCSYCFVEERAEGAMPLEIARAALEMFPAEGRIDVSFFGGEPLLAWKRLVEVVHLAESFPRKLRPKFHVTTNGTLLDEEKVGFLVQHGFSMILSLDGPKYIHDSARPMADGTSSFDATMRGLEHVRSAPPLARRTTLRGTFDPADDPRLVERLAFLNELVCRGYAAGVSVEPATVSEGCRVGQTDPRDASELREQYHAAARWYLAHPGARFFHFDKMLDRLRGRKVICAECGGGRGYLTIGPDGGIFACHREGPTRIGTLNGRLILDEAARSEWLDNRFSTRPACRACWIRHLCGGGCRHAHLVATGSRLTPDPAQCAFKEILVRECLWVLTQQR